MMRILLFSLIFLLPITMQVQAKEIKVNKNDSKQILQLLYGNWVEPNPINSKEYQGFRLEKNGKASSINMYTLVYTSWSYANGKLILVAESIGNHESSVDKNIYPIISITKDKLVLDDQGEKIEYRKDKNNLSSNN